MNIRTLLKLAVLIAVASILIISSISCDLPNNIPFLSKKADSQDVTIKIVPEKPIPTVDQTAANNQPQVAAEKPLSLNKTGQAGCLVCHADKQAVMVINSETKSIYVDQAILKGSPHKDIGCLDCHLDFSYTHDVMQDSYKKVAGLACKNCHDHEKQNIDYRESNHGKAALGGDEKAPTCADCHGSHNVLRVKKSKEDRLAFRQDAFNVCGKCHTDYWDSYNDYYHGRAYKRGADDAPTCWDCHDSHKILPSKDSASRVNKDNIGTTCGICHQGSTDKLAEYVPLIHGHKKERENNLVFKYLDKGIEFLSKPAEAETAKETETPSKASEVLHKVRTLFFPESLRPKE